MAVNVVNPGSSQSQPITRDRIERAMDALAQWMVRLGPDGVKCLPIYERLEGELEALSSTESKMAEIFARAKRSKHQPAAQSSAAQYAATPENRPPHN